jgi:hypothetical protein
MIGRNRIHAVQDAATLQYANGKSMARMTVGSGRFQPLVGFHLEVGKDDEIDAALAAADIPQIEIKHQRTGGAEIVRHWYLGERVHLFVVTSGPIGATVAGSLQGRNAALTAEAGIGLRWGANERSKMAVRGYLDVLVRQGVTRLVQLSTRSRMTDRLLAALVDHERVCVIADSLVDRTRHPEVVSFHEIALPLGTAEEEEWGKGDTATVVPFRSAHPASIDADYLRHVWRPDAIHAAALREWEGIQAWAKEYQVTPDSNGVTEEV